MALVDYIQSTSCTFYNIYGTFGGCNVTRFLNPLLFTKTKTNMKTQIIAISASVLAALSLAVAPVDAQLIGNDKSNTNQQGQGQAQGQGQGQQQGQAQGQGQGQGQAQGQIGINDQKQGQIGINEQRQGQIGINESKNRNNNEANGTNVNANTTDSNATSEGSNAEANGALESTVGDAINQGGSLTNSTSFNEEGDLYLYLPDPVDISLPQNTQPGMSAACSHLQVTADYTGGDSTGVTLWVFGFANSNTPDEIPTTAQQGFDSVVACGLSEQILGITGVSGLSPSEKAAAERLVVDQLMHRLYEANGMEYKARFLDLESVGRTELPTLD